MDNSQYHDMEEFIYRNKLTEGLWKKLRFTYQKPDSMKRYIHIILILLAIFTTLSCSGKEPVPGSYRIDLYREMIEGKTVAVVANQTSMVGQTHLVDNLLNIGIKIKVIFAPEHGFRDLADAGESISNGMDQRTALPLVSLYGNHFKPTPADMEGIDIVIFDIQDVGVRFYTYISTLHYVMEACAENHIKCLVFDRPNPNGFYFDGNIADTAFSSFVGLHPVPVVHGMTVGEYAGMINGEGWLKGGIKCDLTVIRCKDYNHKTHYVLPVKPSPNLPNQNSVYLYPSLCFFEGTNVSVGRGTSFPFQAFGSPLLPDRGFSFIPESVPGAKNPPLLGIRCFGTDLRNALEQKIVPKGALNLNWLIGAYNDFPDKEKFFTPFFDRLGGGPVLRQQIQRGMTADQISKSWQEGLKKFSEMRKKYLLY
jgi:uncharacterized protein YbbC (DUF1343 family)